MDSKKELYQLTLTTGILEPAYSLDQIGDLWDSANVLNDIAGFNITKQGHKFEFKLDNLTTYNHLLHKGLNDEVNNTIIQLYPVYQPTKIIVNFSNVPLGASIEAVEAVILNHHDGKLRSINSERLYQQVLGVSLPTGKWKVTIELEDDDEWDDMPTYTTMFPGRFVGTTHKGQMRPPPSRNNNNIPATTLGDIAKEINTYASNLKHHDSLPKQPSKPDFTWDAPTKPFAWDQPIGKQPAFTFSLHPAIPPPKPVIVISPTILPEIQATTSSSPEPYHATTATTAANVTTCQTSSENMSPNHTIAHMDTSDDFTAPSSETDQSNITSTQSSPTLIPSVTTADPTATPQTLVPSSMPPTNVTSVQQIETESKATATASTTTASTTTASTTTASTTSGFDNKATTTEATTTASTTTASTTTASTTTASTTTASTTTDATTTASTTTDATTTASTTTDPTTTDLTTTDPTTTDLTTTGSWTTPKTSTPKTSRIPRSKNNRATSAATTKPLEYVMKKVFHKRRPPATDEETKEIKPVPKQPKPKPYKFKGDQLKHNLQFGNTDIMAPFAQEEENNMEIAQTDLDAPDRPNIETNIELGMLNYPRDDDLSLESIVHGINNFATRLNNNPHTRRIIAVYATTNFGELPVLTVNGVDKIKSEVPSHLIAASILIRECGAYDKVIKKDEHNYLKHFSRATLNYWKNPPSTLPETKTFMKIYNKLFDKVAQVRGAADDPPSA